MPRRPLHRRAIKLGQICDWPAEVGTPEQVADRVTYTGSPLHKTYPSAAGPPAFRSDKSKCEQYAERDWPTLGAALQAAIRAKCVGPFRAAFPERAWVWINGVLHEARLTNEGTGDYHGFPIHDSRQYPVPIDRLKAAPRVDITTV